MKFAVIGAGKMARALVHDLLANPEVDLIRVGDLDFARAQTFCKSFGDERLRPSLVDARDAPRLERFLNGTDVCVSASSYSVNLEILRACIRVRTHMVDMGGNNTVVAAQLALLGEAERAGIVAIPDMGLAPGLVSVLAASFMKQLRNLEEIHLRVGGLPQKPVPPLNYGIVFSVEGLINEYVEECLVLRNGLRAWVPALSENERIEFPKPFGEMEAFHTSGGSSTLPHTLFGKVRDLDYKTIRYPGHCDLVNAIFDMAFKSHEPVEVDGHPVSPRKVLERLLGMTLPVIEDDVTLLRCWAIGLRDGERACFTYEMIDYPAEGLTSMMRTTAFPVSVAAQMIATGRIKKPGVFPPELCVPPDEMIKELGKRGIEIKFQVALL